MTGQGNIMIDVFSDVLRLIRLKSCVYFMKDFWSPWGMQLGDGTVAQFHAILRGHCVIEANGKTYQGVPGDIFLFPHGAQHTITDKPKQTVVSGMAFMQSLEQETPMFSKGEAATQLICGHYEYRQDFQHFLFKELPSVIHIKNNASISNDVLPLLTREIKTASPGSDTIIERLAEILLIDIIRAHIIQSEQYVGFFQGLLDPRIVKAIQLIHQSPDAPLSLDELSTVAGMSRSAFAFHFKSITGISPISYLTYWRMLLAHDLLHIENLSVWKTAAQVGYLSEISFSRAFKRHFGVSPGQIRQMKPQEN
jgi:AraC-like DNA-binding protein